jgi:hypothetical protein
LRLNLPILEHLAAARSVLLAGMGGGFDILGAIPLLVRFREEGKAVHLASLSFSPHPPRIAKASGLGEFDPVPVVHDAARHAVYFPELHLAQWLREELGLDATIWCFRRSGVQPLFQGYRKLVSELQIDAIVLVDGGVDSLLRGDEALPGTILEDFVTLAAVSELTEVDTRLIGCLGFGTEREVCHAQALESIAALAASGGFRGSCSLVPAMPEVQAYSRAVEWINSRPQQDPSVVHSSTASAIQGHFGDYHATERTQGSRLWINPLMAMYWFFTVEAVAERNLIVSQLLGTETRQEALMAIHQIRSRLAARDGSRIPLP